MSFPFLTPSAHVALDEALRELLGHITAGPVGASVLRAKAVVDQAVEQRLVRPGWEEFWHLHEGVAAAWFGDVSRARAPVNAALLDVFVHLIRFIQTETTDRLRGELARESADALERYLHLRGMTPPEPAGPTDQYVTLGQIAARVSRTKKTLERHLYRSDSTMPPPDVEGGGGKANEWRWSRIRTWLEKTFGRTLPKRLPDPDRFADGRR